jgi:hypothetical protein
MKMKFVVCGSLVALVVALGCGGNGASNNDQGTSVSFLGLFSSSPSTGGTGGSAGCGQLPQGLSGGIITLGQMVYNPASTPTPGFTALQTDPSGAVYAVVGLQNNLYGQFFRADRVLLEYYVAGSNVQPPTTNVAVNILAGPAEAAQGGTTGTTGTTGGTTNPNTTIRRPIVTSLPPVFSQVCNRSFATVPIIPAPIREWLNFNKGQLPEVPFTLEVIVKLSGMSSSGTRYETNAGAFSFNVVPDVQVNPTTNTSTTQSAPLTTNSGAESLSVGAGDSAPEDSSGLDQLERAFSTESSTEG